MQQTRESSSDDDQEWRQIVPVLSEIASGRRNEPEAVDVERAGLRAQGQLAVAFSCKTRAHRAAFLQRSDDP